MRITIAIDSFKGCLSSAEAGQAVKEGVAKVLPDADIIVSPIADGGEGTVRTLVSSLNGEFRYTETVGPLGDKVTAEWGIINAETAVIETASAAGITLIDSERRNPLLASSYGVGELINAAIEEGCRRFIIGIGGSAVNDGGAGMLEALGFELRDEDNNIIPRGAIGLSRLKSISCANANPLLEECSFRVACDVQNPLCGEKGCSRIYGPQKGADEDMIVKMDSWLNDFAVLSGGNPQMPGAGAAGGMGFAFAVFLHASLEKGTGIIIDETRLEETIEASDLVITGEGRMDSQTVMGKVPVGVASIAKKYGKKVIAFCGCADEDAETCNEYGIDAIFPILRNVVTLEEAVDRTRAARNLASTSEQVARLIKIMMSE
ncbi:MAG: glycerate kinase [Clostridia bacterium]|nr:glycerate kinase [Clostridia bacterium]